MGIGLREILILAVIMLLLFGAKRIPNIMGDFAKGIKSFRKGLSDKEEGEAADPGAKEKSDELKRITDARGEPTGQADRTRDRADH